MKLNHALTGHVLATQQERYQQASREKMVAAIKNCALGPAKCGSNVCACTLGTIPWFRSWIVQGIPVKEVIDALDENEDV